MMKKSKNKRKINRSKGRGEKNRLWGKREVCVWGGAGWGGWGVANSAWVGNSGRTVTGSEENKARRQQLKEVFPFFFSNGGCISTWSVTASYFIQFHLKRHSGLDEKTTRAKAPRWMTPSCPLSRRSDGKKKKKPHRQSMTNKVLLVKIPKFQLFVFQLKKQQLTRVLGILILFILHFMINTSIERNYNQA